MFEEVRQYQAVLEEKRAVAARLEDYSLPADLRADLADELQRLGVLVANHYREMETAWLESGFAANTARMCEGWKP